MDFDLIKSELTGSILAPFSLSVSRVGRLSVLTSAGQLKDNFPQIDIPGVVDMPGVRNESDFGGEMVPGSPNE